MIHNEIYLLRRATIDDASECALIVDNWIKLIDQIKGYHNYQQMWRHELNYSAHEFYKSEGFKVKNRKDRG